MANSIFSIAPISSTDAEFRAWGSTLSAQLGAMLTRVVTSGDINWATVAKPTGVSTFMGFEVYRFNDAAQTTHPLFFKFEYGSSPATATQISMRLTIAKTCDAAGVVGGVLFGPTVISYSNSTNAASQTSYISSSDSHLALALCVPLTNTFGGGLIIERAVENNGSTNGDGLLVGYKIYNQASVQWNNTFIAYTAGSANTLSNKGIFPTPLDLASGQSLANGTVTPYFPAACLAPNGLYWIPRVALGGALVDCAAGAVINNLLDGNSYIGIGSIGGSCDQRNNANAGMLMRWS